MPSVKYHYFHRFFTYSVRRRVVAALQVGDWPLRSRIKRGAAPRYRMQSGAPGRSLLCPRGYGWWRLALPLGCVWRVADARSAPRTLSGGEFDWGGTSVKW